MDKFTDETLTEDIRRLAKRLIEDPTTGPIIKYAGIHRSFTESEMQAVRALCDREPFLLAYDKNSWAEGNAYFRNMWTAIAVALRIGEGEFSDVDDIAATAMIDRNKNFLHDPETGECITIGNDPRTQNCYRTIKYEDFLPLLKEFLENEKVQELFKHFLPIYEENYRDNINDDVIDAWVPIESVSWEILCRYGFIQNVKLAVIGRELILQKIDWNDERAVREYCKNYSQIDFGGKS